ncbi:hypothetical protein Hdeb2414_s0008g00273961 [Helianthus debilis subsp. tardiflorus]
MPSLFSFTLSRVFISQTLMMMSPSQSSMAAFVSTASVAIFFVPATTTRPLSFHLTIRL